MRKPLRLAPANARFLRAVLTLTLAVGLAACDSSADDPTIGGTYRGSVTVESIPIAYRIVIPTTTGGSFTWSGAFTYGGADEEPVGGPGTYAYPTITLTDDGDTLAGTVSADGNRLTFTDPESGTQLVVTR